MHSIISRNCVAFVANSNVKDSSFLYDDYVSYSINTPVYLDNSERPDKQERL